VEAECALKGVARVFNKGAPGCAFEGDFARFCWGFARFGAGCWRVCPCALANATGTFGLGFEGSGVVGLGFGPCALADATGTVWLCAIADATGTALGMMRV